MKMIIESEVKRAEALVERYMGLPPETIDLFSFNVDSLRKAPADFGRAISALRQVAGIRSPSQADAAYAVNGDVSRNPRNFRHANSGFEVQWNEKIR